MELNNLVASCQQDVDNLSTSWEQAVRTHQVDKLLEHYCYKFAAGLLQLVRFYVYRTIVATHVKKVVTNLQQTCSNNVPTTCQQGVFALLVPSLWKSCQRLFRNLLQCCWAQQSCYKLCQQLVIVLQFINLSTSCEVVNNVSQICLS
jgi:hypothetical protein